MIKPSPIRFGLPISLSGRYALLGRQVRAAVECYIEATNARGGIAVDASTPARPVSVLVRDDMSDNETCAAVTRELIEKQRVDILLGPYGSGTTRAAAAVAEIAGVVLWNHSGSADQIFRQGYRWLVGSISPTSAYFSAVLEALSIRPEVSTVAVVHAETGFARDVANGALSAAQLFGLKVISHQTYRSGTEDFSAIVNELAANTPDCLLGVGRVEDDMRLAQALAKKGQCFKTAALVVAALDGFKDSLNADSEGYLAPSQWEPGINYLPDVGPTAPEFTKQYTASSDEPLDYPAAQGYAGCLVAERCMIEARSLEQTALREAANRLQFTTFYGPFAIDPITGCRIIHGIAVIQWQAGRKVIIWPPEHRTGTLRIA